MDIVNPNLKDFWREQKPIKLLYGGRDSSKTKDTALYLALLASQVKVRVMCARQFQNRIEQSVYTEMKWAIERWGYSEIYDITQNSIKCTLTGSEFFFYGIRRNLSDIKGAADIDILWIEEGEDLTKEQMEAIEPTIRKESSFIIVLFNPQLVTDYVWSELVSSSRPDIMRRHINYDENPFLSNKSEARIEQLQRDDYDSYLHIYGGQPKKDDNESIIKRAWILSCIDAHTVLEVDIRGGKQTGYDVADSGEDVNVSLHMNGGLVEKVESWKAKEDELFESSVRVYSDAVNTGAKVNYDSNGVGAGVGSNIKQLNTQNNTAIKYYGFDSAESPAYPDHKYKIDGIDTQQTNREYFENRKAQAWWLLADRIKATHRAVTLGEHIDEDVIISISSKVDNIEKLITELSTPRKKTSGRLKNMVEKKEDLKKRGIASPNIADAFVMAAYPYMEDKIPTQSFNIKGL